MRTIVSLLDEATSVVTVGSFSHIIRIGRNGIPLVWMKHTCQDPLLELRLGWTWCSFAC